MLDVAVRLQRLVRDELGAEVVMTRATDVFVPLEERTAIANAQGADLFLSIHANSSRNPSARGVETYFLSFAQDPHAEAVAARENAISPATLKDLQNLVKAIALNSKIDESRDFAASIQESMVAEPAAGRPRRARPRRAHRALLRPHRGQHAEHPGRDRLRLEPPGGAAAAHARTSGPHRAEPARRGARLPRLAQPHAARGS